MKLSGKFKGYDLVVAREFAKEFDGDEEKIGDVQLKPKVSSP